MDIIINMDTYNTHLNKILKECNNSEAREVIEGLLNVTNHYEIDALSLYERISLVMRYSTPNKRNAYTMALLPIEKLLSE